MRLHKKQGPKPTLLMALSLMCALFSFSKIALSQDTIIASDQIVVMSLEDCINYAIDHNIDVKKQALMVENSNADLLQSALIMLPDLNAGGNHIYNWGQTIDRYTNEFATTRVQSNNFYLGTNLTLFSGLTQLNTLKKNELNTIAAEYDMDYLLDNTSLTVAAYYLDILFNEEILQVAKEQLEVTKQQISRMGKMVAAGTLAKGDLLNIEAQGATEELNVIEAENNLLLSYLNMQQLIDYPVTSNFRIEKPELRAIEAPSIIYKAEDIFNIAAQNRPEIKSAEARVQSADKGIAIARGYLSPVLSLQGTWATGYSGLSQVGIDESTVEVPIGMTVEANPVPVVAEYETYGSYETIPFGDQLNENQNKSVGFNLMVPIYNGWQARTAIEKAKIAREDAEYNLQKTKLDLNKTIQQSYADAVAALKNYNAAIKKVDAQNEAFKYAQQKFDVGMMNAVDYNQTKKDLTIAESQLLQAKYRFIYTTTVLDFYMGQPISFK